jgi:hypothetical protein
VNSELEVMWKKVIVEALLRNFSEGLRKTTKTFHQDSRSPKRDLNQRLPEYEAKLQTTGPRCPVQSYGNCGHTSL